MEKPLKELKNLFLYILLLHLNLILAQVGDTLWTFKPIGNL